MKELQPFRKKDRPAYMEQEKRFAKKQGMRQTISSGRIGIMKGDAFDDVFVVDNKGTGAFAYRLDVRDWLAFAQRALLTKRTPILQIEFNRPLGDDVYLIVIQQDDFERMRDASGWTKRTANSSRSDQRRKRRG